MRIVLIVSYDGTNYCGWQIQMNGNTIQAEVEKALTQLLDQKITVVASGRTDAGVHAVGQVCHFDVDNLVLPPNKIATLVNKILPNDIKVISSEIASDDFHARYSAKKKTYRYSFYVSPLTVPLLDRYSLIIPKMPNIEDMQKATGIFVGKHDFKCLCAANSSAKTTIREIYSIDITVVENFNIKQINIDVCGNGFLYNMVRTLAGQILSMGMSTKTIDEIKCAFEESNRGGLAQTLSPNGLTLLKVEYLN